MEIKTRHTPSWTAQAIIYHIYPLGALGAEHHNPGPMEPKPRIRDLVQWIPHLKELGVNTLLLGPIWNSESHGYDTIDLRTLDPRLGTNEDLAWTLSQLKSAGFRILLDAVFNHVGRRFFGFLDVQHHREQSPYRHWFSGLSFDPSSPMGDGIVYDTWDGHWSLVKLRVEHPEVQAYIVDSLRHWITEYDIDGIRLDAADVIDPQLWPVLRDVAGGVKPEFWLFGEQVFGDYRTIAGDNRLHGVTNYECYKGFWSSVNDRNMYEIAYALRRQFEEPGLYTHLAMVNFLDNHDVPRIASKLTQAHGVFPLYLLLSAIPGIPAIYYGSESAVPGVKASDDWPLRPALSVQEIKTRGGHPELVETLGRLMALRKQTPELLYGDYTQVQVDSEYLIFRRRYEDSQVLVGISIADHDRVISMPELAGSAWESLLDPDLPITRVDGGIPEITLPANWGFIIRVHGA